VRYFTQEQDIMKNQTWKNILIILFVAALATVLLIQSNFQIEIVTMIITFSLVLILYYVFYSKKKGVKIDEFTVYQDLKSYRNSWLIAVVAITVISNLDYFGIYSFDLNVALGLVLLIMIFTFWIFHFIYLKRPSAK
jgi:hypothetical protein